VLHQLREGPGISLALGPIDVRDPHRQAAPDQQTGTVREPVVEVRAAAHTPPALTVIIEDLTLADSQVGLFYRVDRHGGHPSPMIVVTVPSVFTRGRPRCLVGLHRWGR
jgi:hypothetical protein